MKRKNDDKIPQHHDDALCGKSLVVVGSLQDLNPLLHTSDEGTSVSLNIQLAYCKELPGFLYFFDSKELFLSLIHIHILKFGTKIFLRQYFLNYGSDEEITTLKQFEHKTIINKYNILGLSCCM